MRIKTGGKSRDFLGDRRVIETYLFLPMKLEDECRWLENVTIGQVYEIGPFGINRWRCDAWVDDEWHEEFYGFKH